MAYRSERREMQGNLALDEADFMAASCRDDLKDLLDTQDEALESDHFDEAYSKDSGSHSRASKGMPSMDP